MIIFNVKDLVVVTDEEDASVYQVSEKDAREVCSLVCNSYGEIKLAGKIAVKYLKTPTKNQLSNHLSRLFRWQTEFGVKS
jgi:hypothetical protein